ncbi:MAG: alanine--tRNA ligase [Candidatus Methanomethylicus sp.]|nr:alanine--tRNA ligase [Candidatus Methanomethylicus sp.]
MHPGSDAYNLQFFRENGFQRKECKSCKRHFWTLDPNQDLCGDSPCVPYTFINSPPTRRSFSIKEMREAFLSFFERNGHTRLGRYPVVARWRDDIFLTIASIACFQPHVTSGDVPPPFNPLTISQPCIRMNDLDNVGKTGGRHLSIFEMMAHHAFSTKEKEIYWKEETVKYHHEFVTKDLGIPGEEISYIEHWWEGGGDAGPDLEGMVRGIELSTLVFMQYKKVGDSYRELPIRIVDTGYGLERFTWISQGTPTAFEAIYGSLLDDFIEIAGIERPNSKALAETTKYAGLMNVVDAGSLKEARAHVAGLLGTSPSSLEQAMFPIETLHAILDHTKTLAFMLSDGIVPSNVQAGYLARLLVRRTHRLMESLGIKQPLSELLRMQLNHWSDQYPDLKQNEDYVSKVADLEVARYGRTIEQGKSLVTRIIKSEGLSKTGILPMEKLIQLYDSNGLPPEVVKEVCATQGVIVDIPDTFDTIVADRHSSQSDEEKESVAKDILEEIPSLPPTDLAYYSQPKAQHLRAKVLYSDTRRVVLDKTIFYPEGGGQLSDLGQLVWNGHVIQVIETQKSRGIVVHFVKGVGDLKEGEEVECLVDWHRRTALAKHHSSTHILLGAARRILGDHVWQVGAQKYVEWSRLDVSHFEKITSEQLRQIETLANRTVEECRPIKTYFEERNKAEQKFGFRLYQGGVVYGPTIRVVETEGWDVEACGGIHCANTGEIGLIKIIKSERIQDGVERIQFASGEAALNVVQGMETVLQNVAVAINSPIERIEAAAAKMVEDYAASRKDMDRLRRSLALEVAPTLFEKAESIDKFKLASRDFEGLIGTDLLVIGSCLVAQEPWLVLLMASKIDGSFILITGSEAMNNGLNAGKILGEVMILLKGKGGGKPDLGQGRVPLTELDRFDEAAAKVKAAVLDVISNKN